MRQVIRGFNRVVEPSFPDNDALPKKGESEHKFDKRFNEWYDDIRINLDRLQDQLTTFFQTDINDSIETQKQSTGQVLNNLNTSLTTNVQNLGDDLETTNQNLINTRVTLEQSIASTQADLEQALQDVRDNLYSV